MGATSANRLGQPKSGELSQYIFDFVQRAGDVVYDSPQMAKNAIWNNTITITAIYLLGLTIIGIPVTLGILFARGFVMGFAIGFLTRDLSFKGLLLSLAAVMPHNIVYIPAVCIGTAASLMFAVLMLKRNFDTTISIFPGFIKYTGIMAVILLVTIGAGMIEGYLTPLVTKAAAGLLSGGTLKQ